MVVYILLLGLKLANKLWGLRWQELHELTGLVSALVAYPATKMSLDFKVREPEHALSYWGVFARSETSMIPSSCVQVIQIFRTTFSEASCIVTSLFVLSNMSAQFS